MPSAVACARIESFTAIRAVLSARVFYLDMRSISDTWISVACQADHNK